MTLSFRIDRRAVKTLLNRLSLPKVLGGTLLAASVVGGFVSSAEGQQGVVKVKNTSYVGDIDDKTVPGKVIVVGANGRTELFRQIVTSIEYFDPTKPKEEFEARLAALGPKDVIGRNALARWAINKKELDLASQAVASTKAIEPSNIDANGLEKQIAVLRPPPPVATQPVATQPAAPVVKIGPAKRLLVADEIQAVRLREMRDGDKSLKFSIPPTLKKDAMTAGLIQAAEVRTIQPNDLAMKILSEGPPELKKQVKFANDPVPLTEYRQKVNRVLVTGCAAATCHGGPQGGNLYLFPIPDKEETALTNFVSLQKFEKTVDGVQRSMINRTQVGASILLGFMLPPDKSKVPHPVVPGYRGVVKTEADPNYVTVAHWMGDTLAPIAPSYEDIDLTTEAKAAPPAGAPAPKPAVPK